MTKSEPELEGLPQDWNIVELGDLLDRMANGLTCKQEKEPPGIPVSRIETISAGVIDFDRVRYVRDMDDTKKEKFLLQQGDLLFSHINSDMHLGKTAVVTSSKPLLHGMNLLVLRTKKGLLDPYYLHYLMNHFRFSGKFISIAQHAVNQSSLNQKKIGSLKIPLAPIEKQRAIVAEIEKQFSRLDEAIANLKRVKANLKRYKAAVLKAAVEGKLTEEWRAAQGRKSVAGGQEPGATKAHPDVEPASKLLDHILAERRAKWEDAELAKMEAKGKAPKNDKWKAKYKEPAAPDTRHLAELPEGWVWASIEQLTFDMMNGYGKRSQSAGTPRIVLRLADIVDGNISFHDVRRINCTDDEVKKYSLSEHDLLILRVNGSPDLVGRFVLAGDLPETALFCDHFIRARCVSSDVATWLRAYGDVERFRRYVDLNKVSSAGQNTINQSTLSPFAIPLPPIDEQVHIAAEMERRLSLVREVEVQIEANRRRADRLRQSILRDAFAGGLLT